MFWQNSTREGFLSDDLMRQGLHAALDAVGDDLVHFGQGVQGAGPGGEEILEAAAELLLKNSPKAKVAPEVQADRKKFLQEIEMFRKGLKKGRFSDSTKLIRDDRDQGRQ